jgi:hypothetical protein
LAQCDGDNVLAGLRTNRDTNVGAYFGGLLGLVAVLYTLSCFVLWVCRLSCIMSALMIRSTTLAVSRYANSVELMLTSSTLLKLILDIEERRPTWSKVT